MIIQRNIHNLTHLLLLVNQLLLSCSTENLLYLVFDSESAPLASAILQHHHQQPGKTIIILKLNKTFTEEEEHLQMDYTNSIIISILSQSLSKVLRFFARKYNLDSINSISKHLCITEHKGPIGRIYSKFKNMFEYKNIRIVLLQRTDDDFIAHINPWPKSSTRTIETYSKSTFKNSTNVCELLFPIDIRNTQMHYVSITNNPPYLYQVQDFRSGSVHIGGTEVRMMELLMSHWNWTVHFCTADDMTIQAIRCTNCRHTQSKIDRVFKTILPINGALQPNETCNLFMTNINYRDNSIYGFTTAQIFSVPDTKYLHSFAYERMVFIVPTERDQSSILWRTIVRSPLFNVWILQIFLFSILRKVLQMGSMSGYVQAFPAFLSHVWSDFWHIIRRNIRS